MILVDNFKITDNDIDNIQRLLGNGIHFDRERRKVIKAFDGKDVQAFPGTGKTTMLVAKIGILASKWQIPYQGLCVLSHTNVAKDEVKNKLGKTSAGQQLLQYPHFIGTIDSFFSEFIASPWIRSQGKKISIIDDDIAAGYRKSKIPRKYLYSLSKRGNTGYDIQYANQIGRISLHGISSRTTSYKMCINAIENSIENGIYTYKEVLLYALDALRSDNEISKIISGRFPLVFIDEAQDTSLIQGTLIKLTFNSSIVQSFGDQNQEIFENTRENDSAFFPTANEIQPYVINDSQRFSNQIAKLASPLAITDKGVTGSQKNYANIKNKILLFDKQHIDRVLPKFGDLILKNFSDDVLENNKNLKCFAVGFIHHRDEKADSKFFPRGVYNYYHDYLPKLSQSTTLKRDFVYLIDYFRYAKFLLQTTHSSYWAIVEVNEGLRRVANQRAAGNVYQSGGKYPFSPFKKALSDKEMSSFREVVFSSLFQDIDTKKDWYKLLTKFTYFMKKMGDNKAAHNFIEWQEDNVGLKRSFDNDSNVYHYRNETKHRQVDVYLNSIHGIKGQTHLATLVLESHYYDYCLKKLLPLLEGGVPTDKQKKQKIFLMLMKTHYVAMTRPKAFLCLALPENEVNDSDKKKLLRIGWDIEYV